MLGYKLIKIRKSVQGFDYESDAILLLSVDKPYIIGTVFFNNNAYDELIPVRAEYEDPETGVIRGITL